MTFDLNFNKFDERTLVFKDVSGSFLDRIYESTLSLLEPIVKASKQQSDTKLKMTNEVEKKLTFSNKLLSIDSIRK